MEKVISALAKQFEFEPIIENAAALKKARKFVLAGMGGSHLSAGLLKIFAPRIDVVVHRDYGLPEVSSLKNRLFIASSYSGNTEEVLDFFEQARQKNLPLAAISVGGKLLELAKTYNIAYVQMPDRGIQPRSALGFSIRALIKIMGQERLLKTSAKLAKLLKPEQLKEPGKNLAQKIVGKIPIIYASNSNEPIAYNWKIKLNETGKSPAFYNVFPELNHNEIEGFEVGKIHPALTEKFYFIFLKDNSDHPRIQKRMTILGELLKERNLLVEVVELHDKNPWLKVFSNLLLADWTALYLAINYNLEPEKVALIEEFKKLMNQWSLINAQRHYPGI